MRLRRPDSQAVRSINLRSINLWTHRFGSANAWAGIIVCILYFYFGSLARAGGPKVVAGSSYFNSSTMGQPLVWGEGVVTYYTDQGDLSPVLPNASANSLVASAFGQWTAVPTAALAITSGGQLAEDVNGSNVTVNSDGTISMPADIQSTAVGTPVGIVYDLDGSVTNAFLGAGAGDASQCFSNAVFGGDDNYGPSATYLHALIVINGQCAQESSQLTDVEYRLVRVLGSVLGLGWSEVNSNVQSGSPPPTADDFAGFPVMHFADPLNCVPIAICYANPYQLAMDDTAAISRLYPVTAENQTSFPGSQIFSAVTARIHGSVWFTDPQGNPTQAMQGANVVARWIDPTTGLASHRYTVSGVSGALFTGDQGNPVTGFDDALGDPLTQWGSNDQSLEGFFDLAGIQPGNGTSVQYQLSVEALDPLWSAQVGPYTPGPVTPSGVDPPLTVTVVTGGDADQDVLMVGPAQAVPYAVSNWTAPAAMPIGGDWESSLSGYGAMDYFLLEAQANRTLSVAVTALDESSGASLVKAQPVIGVWAASDLQGTSPPAFTASPFNQLNYGLTRLDASVLTSTNFLIGISDVRGDGRPDYRYEGYVLYGDSVSPARVGVSGGAVTVQGTGFYSGLTTSIGSLSARPIAVGGNQMILSAPAQADGTQNISIRDPASGGSSLMTAVLTYGAAVTDNIVLLGGGLNSRTPVGIQATIPVTVRVLAADGITPVSGATIGWSATNEVQLSACAGASACSMTSDQSGYAVTWLTPAVIGVSTITATLAPAAYNPAKSVSATLDASESPSDIGVSTPYVYVAEGATISLSVTARLLSNGIPQSGATVNFTTVNGAGVLSSGSALTSSSGYATVTLTVTQFTTSVQVNACAAPANVPCQPLYANAVPLAQQNLQTVSGAGQVSTGLAFQPIVVRVTDNSSPPNPVIAASVSYFNTVLRPVGSGTSSGNPMNPAMPVILSVSQSNATADMNGLSSFMPTSAGFNAPLEVDVTATGGNSGSIDFPLEVYAPLDNSNSSGGIGQRPVAHTPTRVLGAAAGKEAVFVHE